MTLAPNTLLNKAENCLPFFDSDNQRKRRYLSYRVCGFSRLESRRNIGLPKSTIDMWCKRDTAFAQIEQQGILELSRQFRAEVVALEYTRNFKLALDIDRKVFEKQTQGKVLTTEEWEYLKKIRPLYTPANMKALEDLITGVKEAGVNSWDEILQMSVTLMRKGNEYQAVGNEEPRYYIEAPSGTEEFEEGTDNAEVEGEGAWE